MVYPAGNYIECTTDAVADRRAQIRQAGARPRHAHYACLELYEAFKTSLISMDSTMRSISAIACRSTCFRWCTPTSPRADLNHRIRRASRIFTICARAESGGAARDAPEYSRPPYKTETEAKSLKKVRNQMAEGGANKIASGDRCRLRCRTRGVAGADDFTSSTVVLAGRRKCCRETKKARRHVGQKRPRLRRHD